MQKQQKFGARLYGKNSAITANILMVFLFCVGIVMLVDTSFDDVEQIAAVTNPLLSAIGLILAIPVISIVMVFLSKFDRRCTEDYTFQLMANAALIAVVTMLFFHMLSTFDALNTLTGLRELQRDDFMAITIMSWSAAYFIYQRKGLKE